MSSRLERVRLTVPGEPDDDGRPVARLLDALSARGGMVKLCGPGRWQARCPAHDDRVPSLSVRETPTGVVLVHDHAGCATADVLAALGLGSRDLFPAGFRSRLHTNGRSTSSPDLDILYAYHDEEGRLLFQVVRRPGKKFLQRRPDPDRPGEWIWKLDDIRRVLYRLPARGHRWRGRR